MDKVSLEQILATIPQQSRSKLGQKVSGSDLAEIARALVNWESFCAELGIDEAEVEAIKEENQRIVARR